MDVKGTVFYSGNETYTGITDIEGYLQIGQVGAAGALTGAVGLHRVGNSTRLPG